MRKSQIDEISDLLLSYSAGKYHLKGEISGRADDIDMIILGINMLGEELRSTNVSKEYFSSIFNAVTDLVLVVDEKGILVEYNLSAYNHLGYSKNELEDYSILDLFSDQDKELFNEIKLNLEGDLNKYIVESVLMSKSKETIFGLFTCSKIFNRDDKLDGYLLSVEDITAQKENEKLILKTIISTQSAEQTRVADDLHDSIGQDLSMAQLLLSNFRRFEVEDQEFFNLLEFCEEILEGSINHLREICFDLMPNVLVKGGLELAITTLVGKLQNADPKMKIEFVCSFEFPRLYGELEIVIYRILQEFVNNMIKHSSATILDINLVNSEGKVELFVAENGQGFDLEKLKNIGENRGVSNIKTKVLAYNGLYEFKSKPGKGTNIWVEFPKKLKDE